MKYISTRKRGIMYIISPPAHGPAGPGCFSGFGLTTVPVVGTPVVEAPTLGAPLAGARDASPEDAGLSERD